MSPVFIGYLASFQGIDKKDVQPDETFLGLGMDDFRLQEFLSKMEEKNEIIINEPTNINLTLCSVEKSIRELIVNKLIDNRLN